ncbi:MAG TPA: hypothetical protein VM912_17085 [Terriglobales bacterium]|nr:hypothetical protein [Terriglobales bacterium]
MADRICLMAQTAHTETRPAADVVRTAKVAQAPNGVCYAMIGENTISRDDLERAIGAVPPAIAAALQRKAYYFVPLTVGDGEDTRIAESYDAELGDRAVCHRNFNVGSSQCVFISTRVMEDKFSVAFEFFINVGHAFVEKAGVSEDFAAIVWKQAESNIRGESSMDAFELRKLATGQSGDREKARNEYLNSTFADAIAVYLLSLAVDVDYYDLRERDYPLLAPGALAERLRKCAELFPPNPGYEFAIHYRRR